MITKHEYQIRIKEILDTIVFDKYLMFDGNICQTFTRNYRRIRSDIRVVFDFIVLTFNSDIAEVSAVNPYRVEEKIFY